MRCRTLLFAAGSLFSAALLRGQETVCDLFKDLKAADASQLILSGDLIISKSVAALGAADCENEFSSPLEGRGIRVLQRWPTAVHLRPSSSVPPSQMQQFQQASDEADRLRRAGKLISASASFVGRLRVVPVGDFPAEFTFDAIESISVKELPDASELPVIPICDLFQNLLAWKGKRIAVRGESVSTSEGSWITGSCKGGFYTDSYRWPVLLNYGGPAYYSDSTALLSEVKRSQGPPKGWALFQGRNNVIQSATYVGRLRMRNQYTAVCRAGGDYIANGFGHLGSAAAELIVETISDVELTPRPPREDDDVDEPSCQPANHDALCASATTLSRAVSQNCVNRTRELLSKDGIDSKEGNESSALTAAIRLGNETIVTLLLDAGAPVNPVTTRLFAPLAEAAQARKPRIMATLLKRGANVDWQDHQGATYLASFGFFDTRVTKILLAAGANPNARDRKGETALMKASGYGYEDAVKLLVLYSADVNLTDNKGRSALMHAAAGRYIDAIPHLLANGADLYMRDLEGKTALDIAKASGNQFAVELLSSPKTGDK